MDMNLFHEGERSVQQRVGQTQEAARNAPMITPRIPAGAIPFVAQQSLLVLAVTEGDAIWCLPVVGDPGWMTATAGALSLDLEQVVDPLDERVLRAAKQQQLVGAIILDFATRRRLRINGRLERSSGKKMVLSVAEAYPNCPKYITQRTLISAVNSPFAADTEGVSLTPEQIEAFTSTDLLFLATQHPERGLDASHRGGNPGFLESPATNTLRFRDYAGNSLFNTLGNLEVDSRVGVFLPDFSNGRALMATGSASTDFADEGRTRCTTITIQRWTETRLSLKETARQLSPYNP